MSDAVAKMRAWREYPAQFVHENFGIEPDPWQLKVLNDLGGPYNSQRRVAMKACTGPGKSCLLAWEGWRRLSCYAMPGEYPKGAALSITKDNLQDNLWAELKKWQKRSPFLEACFQWTKSQIYSREHPADWFLSARSFAKDADPDTIGRALSGLHSQFPFILLDEIGDMPDAVGRAAEQIFTGAPSDALICAAGNPTSIEGLLYTIATRQASRWQMTTITSDPEDPDRTPRVSKELAQQQIDDYGRENPWVMATILGLFPPSAFNALLGVDDVEKAMNRHYDKEMYNFAPIILGVDVAREGNDCSTIFPRQGIVAHKPAIYRNLRSYQLASYVAKKEDAMNADGVIVDSTGGWGAGVIDAYEQLGRHCIGCNYSEAAYEKEKYYNRRAENWWKMAEWIKDGGALPYIKEMIRELTVPTYTFMKGRILIEPKEKIKEKLGKSPDLADSLSQTFAEEIRKRHPLDEWVDAQDQHSDKWDPFADL